MPFVFFKSLKNNNFILLKKSIIMNKIITLVLALLVQMSFAQEIPYALNPGWESTPMGHVATGLALADINGDGWKDIVVANGNDISRQSLVVYLNNGDGSFPLAPSWSSGDIDYHGHCAAGDINGDGWTDVAVSVYIGPEGFSEPGRVKVYYNQGGELETVPSFESVTFYTFSCALGDADGDGDLDLAAAASESYGDIWDYAKVFINHNGSYNQQPEWESANLAGTMDVDFADMDNNGFLDLVFIGNEYPNAIYLADNSGVIDPNPDWQSLETNNYNNSLDIGFMGEEGYPAFVTTGNDQLGGDGKIRLYAFPGGVPVNSTADWISPYVGYGSGVFLADVTRDGMPDLIYGGWWQPIEILTGNGVSFNNEPAYTSNTGSVVEAIQLADLGREAVVPLWDTLSPASDQVHALRLPVQVTENILQVYKNDVLLPADAYCCVPGKNWISFAQPLNQADVVRVKYEHSADPDMVVTNWDGAVGNYIFYNTNTPTGIHPGNMISGLQIFPNPASTIVNICASKTIKSISITDLYGKQKMMLHPERKALKIDISQFTSGQYFLTIKTAQKICTSKLLIYH